MKSPKGRRVAIAAGAVALIVLAVAVVTVRDRISERWWLWRLKSSSETERVRAHERLVAMKSRNYILFVFDSVFDIDIGTAGRVSRSEILAFVYNRIRDMDPKIMDPEFIADVLMDEIAAGTERGIRIQHFLEAWRRDRGEPSTIDRPGLSAIFKEWYPPASTRD
jgi:hypothetical protein